MQTAKIVAIAVLVVGLIVPPAVAGTAGAPICGAGESILCVVDGDTLHLGGDVVRIQNIDAPETKQARCDAEGRLGRLAMQRLAVLLAGGTARLVVVPKERDRDRYGRLLRRVEVDGVDLGETLVTEGLARPWDGRRHPWC